jgi:4-amino-4-deoxy-L-arabinose transferase-like glycosyltransferase
MYYLSKHSEYTADSYYFLLLARSLRDTFTYTVRGVAHTKYLPGYPIAIWFGGYLFGGLERAANVLAVLGGTFTVLVTYGLGRELFDKRVGVVAALVIALQPTFLKWTCLPMTEGLFTFLFAGGIYLLLTGCKRGSASRRLLGAAAGGLCLLVRWEGLLFLPLAVVVVIAYRKSSKLKAWEPFAMLALVCLPIGVYVIRNLIATGRVTSYSSEYSEYSTEMSFAVFKHRLKVYGWNGMSSAAFSLIFYLGAAWMLVRKRWREFFVVAGWFGMFLGFHMFWYYAYERFMAPAAPAAALAAAFLWVDLWVLAGGALAEDGWLAKRWKASPGARAFLKNGVRVVLILALAALLLHGALRADSLIEQNYRAFADDHGGKGMVQAADWLKANTQGRLVAVDAGPYFNWLYYPGDVLYMRPVPWDLPVEEADVSYDGALDQLHERGVRYLVVGHTEKGLDDELALFGIDEAGRRRLVEKARWENKYDYPEPHELVTAVFEILPRD